MADYLAPLKQMRSTIEHLADFAEVGALPDFQSADATWSRRFSRKPRNSPAGCWPRPT